MKKVDFRFSVCRISIWMKELSVVTLLLSVVRVVATVPRSEKGGSKSTGTRIPDPPFSSFGPSRDYGMDLCREVYI